MYIVEVTMGKKVWRILKQLKIELPYDPAIPVLGICLENSEHSTSRRYMHTSVHDSIVYNSRDMEATQVSINRWYFVGRDKLRGKD